jgi:hypothetical protein
MAYVTPNALDAFLAYIRTNADRFFVCSEEPTTYAEAATTFNLGTKTSPTIAAPADGASSGGRVITVAAFTVTDGVTASGYASYYALGKSGTSELLFVQECDPIMPVVSGEDLILEDDLEIEAPGISPVDEN